MKTNLIILAISLFTISVSGQEDSYTSAMKSTLLQMDQALGAEQYLDCANRFERIASAEKSKWMPYYYASHCLAIMSFEESNGEQKDKILDRAQELLDRSMELNTEKSVKSELQVLQAFIYPSRIMVDPMGRGGIYFEKMFTSLETSKALNPDNPRPYFLEGTYKLNIPEAMGGGTEKAQPILEEALVLYEAFSKPDPLWPAWGEDATRAELEKIQ
jgi:hypothetical protein